jgi:hypothetical protein
MLRLVRERMAYTRMGNTPNPVNVAGDQKQVTIAPATGNLFFRLFHP